MMSESDPIQPENPPAATPAVGEATPNAEVPAVPPAIDALGAGGTLPYGRRIPVKPPLLRPRKVRGGIKVPAGDVAPATAWAAQRWLRLIEQAAEGPRLVEALDDYARAGQTKRLSFVVGRLEAAIQGRADRPYTTQISLSAFSHETWDKIVEAMAEGSLYSAKLLANELPPNIEDVFAPLGLKLFPVDPAEVKHSCTCVEWRQENGGNPNIFANGKWCKHVCCAAYLLAQRLASEPFVIFLLRGQEGQELLERLRQRRVMAGAGLGFTPIYSQRVPGVADLSNPPLEESISQFWDAGPGLTEIDLSLAPPPVSHPLLRRLGQSPFQQAQFPLVGLLASCYEVISQQAREGVASVGAADGAEAQDPEAEVQDDES